MGLEFCCSYELEVEKNRNIIALLETGTDKSGIINMVIKAMGASDSDKRLIICLAPTVNLVKQASPITCVCVVVSYVKEKLLLLGFCMVLLDLFSLTGRYWQMKH